MIRTLLSVAAAHLAWREAQAAGGTSPIRASLPLVRGRASACPEGRKRGRVPPARLGKPRGGPPCPETT
jgi:hypothetical protein